MNKYTWIAIPIYTIGYGFGMVVTYVNAIHMSRFSYIAGIGASILGVYIAVKITDLMMERELLKTLSTLAYMQNKKKELNYEKY